MHQQPLLQEQILKIIRQNSKVSYELLMMKLGKDRTTIMRNIQKLKETGVIRRSGSKKKRLLGNFVAISSCRHKMSAR
jgi:predicted HTH transcriptional regulator